MFHSNCYTNVSPPSRSASRVLNALLAVLLLAGVASADTIMVTGLDTGRGESIWINEDGVDKDAYFAGVILISVFSGGQEYQRDSVCVDLFTNIGFGLYDTTLLHPNQVQGKNLPRVAWLVDNFVPPVPLPSSSPWVVDSPAKGAGLQLAIWDIVHDNGDGFSSGRVQFAAATPGDVEYWAGIYESASAGMQSGLAFVYRNSIQETTTPAQMLIGPGYYQDHGPEPNPEPPTLVLGMGALLIGIGKFFRPRLRNRTTA